MTNAGTITLESGAGVVTAWTPATARPAPVEAERQLFRPPYGTAWFVDGDDLRGVERLAVSFEVIDEVLGIQNAAAKIPARLEALATAALIDTPWGAFVPRGVLSVARSPIGAGFHVDVALATDGWQATDADLMRFISGPLWELR